MTPTEQVLRDAIVELAETMLRHVDPRQIRVLIERLRNLDATKEQE